MSSEDDKRFTAPNKRAQGTNLGAVDQPAPLSAAADTRIRQTRLSADAISMC